MKRRLLAGLMAGALLLGGAARAEVDLSGMSYDELVDLHSRVVGALAVSDGVVSFRADPGEYLVGRDVPAGRYSVKLADGVEFGNLTVDSVRGSWRLKESFDNSEDPDKVLGQVILEDGEAIKVKGGALFFGAPAGITFN